MEWITAKILHSYGRAMQLRYAGGEQTVYGFFQPDTGRADRLSKLQPGPLGLENQNRYIYIGPAEPAISQGDEIVVSGKHYLVQTAEAVCGTRQTAYVWAMCVEKGGAQTWGRNG